MTLPADPVLTREKARDDDTSRCAVCGWPLYADRMQGCIIGNCSLRPLPRRFYSPDRVKAEYGRFAPEEADPYKPCAECVSLRAQLTAAQQEREEATSHWHRCARLASDLKACPVCRWPVPGDNYQWICVCCGCQIGLDDPEKYAKEWDGSWWAKEIDRKPRILEAAEALCRSHVEEIGRLKEEHARQMAAVTKWGRENLTHYHNDHGEHLENSCDVCGLTQEVIRLLGEATPRP